MTLQAFGVQTPMGRESTAERLAMLAAKSQTFETVGAGHDRLTREDLAGGLAGLKEEGAGYLALLKYVQDTSVQEQVFYHLHLKAVDLAIARKWEMGEVQKDTLRRLVRLAIAECVGDFRCDHCNGAGIHNNQQTCRRCKGTGNARVTDPARYRAVQIDKASWHRRWRYRYHQILLMVDDWDHEVLQHLGRQLRPCQ